MLFCTSTFAYFFLAVFLVYWALPWPRVRVGLLLLVSIFFYAVWNTKLAGLVFASSTADFYLARGIEASPSPRRKRLLLGLSLAFNLGLLGYLKYANFFLRSLEAAAAAAGLEATLPVLKVILPIGISFYTFEAISYVVDVYRGRVRAERHLTALPALHPLLSAPGGGADRPGPRFPAASRAGQAVELGSGGTRGVG